MRVVQQQEYLQGLQDGKFNPQTAAQPFSGGGAPTVPTSQADEITITYDGQYYSLKAIIATGTAGSASSVPVIAYNVYGQITGVTDTAIAGLAASVIASGVFAPARLGSGIPTSSTLLDGSGAWRALTSTDIPSLDAAKITTGVFGTARLGTGSATISTWLRGDGTWASVPTGLTSVGLSVPSWLTVTGSPLTSNGTLAVTATTGLTANQVLATPDGATGALSPRALVAADIPSLDASKIGSGTIATGRLGSGTPSASTFLRGDQTWATVISLPAAGTASNTLRDNGSAWVSDNTITNDGAGNLTASPASTGSTSYTGYGYGSAASASAAYYKAAGTKASPTAIAAGSISALGFGGYNGSSFIANRAIVLCQATETWSGSAQGTSLLLQTTPTGSTSRRNDVKIQDGNFIVNDTGVALATSATTAFLYPPNMAGAPTGTPATLPTGASPFVVNTNQNAHHCYLNSAWRMTSATGGTQTTAAISVTMTDGVRFLRITGGTGTTVTLPTASLYAGSFICVRNDSGSNATVNASSTITLTAGAACILVSDGTSWYRASS